MSFRCSRNCAASCPRLRSLLWTTAAATEPGNGFRAWPACRGLRLDRNLGQSAAMFYGLHAATGDLCGVMDGDGQNDPANFQVLLREWARGEADVICGYREQRADTWNRRIASRIANGIRRWFLDDGVRDTGCSQKVFPRHAVELLVPFRGLHRYLARDLQTGGTAYGRSAHPPPAAAGRAIQVHQLVARPGRRLRPDRRPLAAETQAAAPAAAPRPLKATSRLRGCGEGSRLSDGAGMRFFLRLSGAVVRDGAPEAGGGAGGVLVVESDRGAAAHCLRAGSRAGSDAGLTPK